MPLAKPSAIASPPSGVYPFNANTTDSLILDQTPYMLPPVPQAFDNPRVGLPQASISTQPAVARPSITSSSANSAAPATPSIIMSASAHGSLPLKTQPMKAATSQVHNFEDLSSATSITSPKDSVIDSVTPSIASSALLVPQITRCLAVDEPVEFVDSPYRQRLSLQDVEGIIDNSNVSFLGQGTTKSNAKFTILLIGETGTGKTSFLSLLINVLAGRVPDEYDLEPYDTTNEFVSGQSHSRTNAAKVYTFKSVNGVQVTVLDTPGLADTRGLEKDNENKQSITDAIRDSIPEITAVIIVANGTDPRLSVATDYAITTLSSTFSGTLADNIGFLATNISPLNWNFDIETLPVELQGAKTFLLDNPLARHKEYLYMKAAEARGSVAEDSQAVLQKLKKTVDEGHETTLATLAELFDWLDGLVPQATTDITLLYDQLMEIERNISSMLAHMTQLVEKRGKLDDLLNKSDGMPLTFNEMANVKSVIHKKTWILQDKPYHSTICVHPQCYSNCHIQCHVEFTLDPMKLIHCMAFPSEGACQFCNHSVQAHQHYNALWSEKHETEEYVDAPSEQRYDEATTMFEGTQVSIEDIQNFIDIIGKEMADATGEIGRLTAEYSTLSLSRSFSGQVKKFAKVLETHLEAIRHKMDDTSVKRMEASLEQLREKLRVLELRRM
ncbi:uncharacterized protein LACBIDRAFT_303842 [Laccaria bicolor S238N-H82]|uniref:Predicted protein n=1 Tax=Laccaria bicolor (strain S238N-H82 / ATCC MYA-4686) TaxID=486041 RepID=B0DKG6_LACBS|nr:uncharacterized protein LACBIDRAFT_303842 [Laccaria bicolor S238N-H82]EDR04943.1 predicted protein [Laccaria bicolor S238N-H82]|eukprot:XP_001884333.1 predicted protein [Laccaria bicolor S238N-H82]